MHTLREDFMETINMVELKDFIKKHEGLNLKPYACSANKTTIGYGRNLTDNGITKREAEILFEHDVAIAKQDLFKIFNHQVGEFTEGQFIALVDMMYNLGISRFKEFKKMIKAIKAKDWSKAKKEAFDSLWAKQVGTRAKNVINLF